MNWTYLKAASFPPLLAALTITLTTGMGFAIWLNQEGGSSRLALSRLLRFMGLVFALVFLSVSLWEARVVLRGFVGLAFGCPLDQRAMGMLRLRGEGFLAKDPVKAAYWFQKSAGGGDAEAQLLLARTLLNGVGLPRDPRAALQWAQAAADQNLPDAMLLTGDLLRQTDIGAADAWYHRAASTFQARSQSGDADACLALGLIHTTGRGVPKDLVEGLAWMKVAERRGLYPLRMVAVRLTESRATPTERTAAAQRAETIQGVLAKGSPQPTTLTPP